MPIFILIMVFQMPSGPVTSINQEYTSMEKCVAAKNLNREQLSAGKVVLATCTAR